MTAPAVIPMSFLKRARRHLLRAGQPLLFGPRRQSDVALLVDKNEASERWVVLADPRSVPVLLDELVEAVQKSDAPETPQFTNLMLRFATYAAIALRGLPDEFRATNGTLIGKVCVADDCCVFVSDALAVSCLSWVLRHHTPRIGFFLVNDSD